MPGVVPIVTLDHWHAEQLARKNTLLVDIHTAAEYRAALIPGARPFPGEELSPATPE